MEILGLFEVPLWLLLISVVCILLYKYGVYPYKEWARLGVACPPSTPFFGHMRQMLQDKGGYRGCFERWQREYGRIIGLYFFRRPLLLVTDLEALKEIYVKDFHSYVDRYLAGDESLTQKVLAQGVFFQKGSNWQRIRRIMTPAFSSGKLKLFTRRINLTAKRLAECLLTNANEGVQTDAKRVFGAFTIDSIAGTAFSLDLDSLSNPDGEFVTEAKKLVTADSRTQLVMAVVEIFPFLGQFFKFFKIGFNKTGPIDYFEKQMNLYISDRKTHPEQYKELDFMQLLLNAEADPTEVIVGSHKLTLEEVAAQGVLFIIAGYETSSAALQFITYELARHPEIQDKLIAEIEQVVCDDKEVTYEDCQNLKYTEAVINEALRMYPPLHIITRKAVKATTLKGIPIAAGTPVFIPVYNIGRDPEYFDDPDTFNPERFLGENKQKIDSVSFLPFGFGPRQCIGMRLAIIQLKIALAHILRKVSVIDATPKQMDMQDFSGLLVPKEKVIITLESRV